MFAPLLSFDRRALRLSTLVLAGALTLTACDTDDPMSPKHPDLPTTAKPALALNAGTLLIKVVDKNQALITTSIAEFKVTGPNNATMNVKDNFLNDADPTVGQIQMKGLAPGLYQACETTAPVNYVLPNPVCGFATVYVGATTGLTFMNPTMARVQWSVVDAVGNFVPGMVFTLKDSTNAIVTLITDNVGADTDPTGGKFDIRWPTEGTFTLCEGPPPAGYVYPKAQIKFCFPFQIKHGQTKVVAKFSVYPVASAYWQVSDGILLPTFYWNLIGPSTFTVTPVAGGVPITVVDNGANDIDPTLGKLAAKLPSAGAYSICETVPPNGYWNAQPACKQIEVATGEPAWAQWFFNQEKQVVYNP